MPSTTTAITPAYEVVWEKLPKDFVLPNDPVDNIHQPAVVPLSLSVGTVLEGFWLVLKIQSVGIDRTPFHDSH